MPDKKKHHKMQAPEGVCDATIEGHQYDIDDKGQVKVVNEAHIPILKRHGFTDVVETEETADDIMAMDREALTEFIEERGGEVEDGLKMKKLKARALRAGGFLKEAQKLEKKG